MATYDLAHTVKEELDTYFKKNNLGEDGGLNKAYGKIKVGPIYFPIPNPESRRKALVFHDMHHIATGYDGDWKGEVSIGAWEVASGCGNYYVAWFLDLLAMAVGLFIFPKHVYKGFIKGKRTINLYHHTLTKLEAENMRIGDLQKYMHLIPVNESKANAKETDRKSVV